MEFVWGLCRFERGKGLEFGALDSGRNGVNLWRDEFSRQNGVSQRTNDESSISWGEVFKLIADLATIAQFALKF